MARDNLKPDLIDLIAREAKWNYSLTKKDKLIDEDKTMNIFKIYSINSKTYIRNESVV